MKNLTITITEESYQILENLIGITWSLENGDSYAIKDKGKKWHFGINTRGTIIKIIPDNVVIDIKK